MQIQAGYPARLGLWPRTRISPPPNIPLCCAADLLSVLGILLRGWLGRMLCPAVPRGPGVGSKRPAALLRTPINSPALQGLGSSTERRDSLLKANGRMSQDF